MLPLAAFTAQQHQAPIKALETPWVLLYYPAWQINVCRGDQCKALCEHERRGGEMNCLSCSKIGRIQVIRAFHLPLTSRGAH